MCHHHHHHQHPTNDFHPLLSSPNDSLYMCSSPFMVTRTHGIGCSYEQHIQDLILTKKSTVEELNDVCEALMEKSACSTVRDRTVDLQKSFSTLLGKVQGNCASKVGVLGVHGTISHLLYHKYIYCLTFSLHRFYHKTRKESRQSYRVFVL